MASPGGSRVLRLPACGGRCRSEAPAECFGFHLQQAVERATNAWIAGLRRLTQALHGDGRIFVTATYLNDRFWLRPSIDIFRTHAEHLDEILEILKDFIADL